MSDLIIPSENDKATVLNQIDALHEEHRMKILKELANDYNANEPYAYKHIDLTKDGTNAFDLIFALWARDIQIPQGLGFGDLYDSIFYDATIPRGLHDRYAVKNLCPVILIQNPSLVRFLLLSATRLCDDSVTNTIVNACIGKIRRKDGSTWPMMKTREQLREFLRDDEVTPMDLAYLVISLQLNNMFYEDFSIEDIEFYVSG